MIGRWGCVLGFLCCYVACVEAQISIECRGGVNVAGLSDPGNLVQGAVWKLRTGMIGGVGLRIPLAEKLALVPGVRFVQKGMKPDWYLAKITVTNNYLDIPVYLSYDLLDFGSTLAVESGPSLGILLGSRSEGTVYGVGWESFDTKTDYKSYDVTLDCGLSLRTPVTKTLGVVITGAYSHGIVNIQQFDSKSQTRDVRVTVGVSYALE